MRTYRVAQVYREADSWIVIRSGGGEEDEPLGQYPDRASAQAAWERLVAAEAKGEDAEDQDQPDTRYEIFQDGDAYKVRITRLGEFKQEADGFSSQADAEAWVAQAKRLGSVSDEQKETIKSQHLRVVKP
jgi:hypothetical protein